MLMCDASCRWLRVCGFMAPVGPASRRHFRSSSHAAHTSTSRTSGGGFPGFPFPFSILQCVLWLYSQQMGRRLICSLRSPFSKQLLFGLEEPIGALKHLMSQLDKSDTAWLTSEAISVRWCGLCFGRLPSYNTCALHPWLQKLATWRAEQLA